MKATVRLLTGKGCNSAEPMLVSLTRTGGPTAFSSRLAKGRNVREGHDGIRFLHLRRRYRGDRLGCRGVLPEMQGRYGPYDHYEIRGRDPTGAVQPLRRRPCVSQAAGRDRRRGRPGGREEP